MATDQIRRTKYLAMLVEWSADAKHFLQVLAMAKRRTVVLLRVNIEVQPFNFKRQLSGNR